MDTPIPIHPYDLYDLLSGFSIEQLTDIEHKEGPNGVYGPSILKVVDKWYIEDVNTPYTGTNPEFLEILKENK